PHSELVACPIRTNCSNDAEPEDLVAQRSMPHNADTRSRSMAARKLQSICGAVLVMCLAAAGAAAQGGAAPQPLVDHELKPTIHWCEGAGGNSGVIVGSNGVIVIDAKTSAAGATELLADIAKLTPKPVTTVIITHSDGDHVNGLQSFPKGVA